MIDLLFIGMLQAVAGQPAARPATEVAGVTTQAEIDPDDVVVCRSVRPIGSRVPARRCTSRNSDELARAQAADLVREVLRNNLTSNPQGGFGAAGSGKRGGTGPGN